MSRRLACPTPWLPRKGTQHPYHLAQANAGLGTGCNVLGRLAGPAALCPVPSPTLPYSTTSTCPGGTLHFSGGPLARRHRTAVVGAARKRGLVSATTTGMRLQASLPGRHHRDPRHAHQLGSVQHPREGDTPPLRRPDSRGLTASPTHRALAVAHMNVVQHEEPGAPWFS